MHVTHTAMPRSTPLGKCEENFPRQDGPQCKVFALAIVHHVLCACKQFPLHKYGDEKVLSARKVAKLCGSAVGEICSLQQFNAVAHQMGLATETIQFDDYESMVSILKEIFASNRHVIFFVQWERRSGCSYPGVTDCDDQYLEHGMVCSGWALPTQRMLAETSDNQDNDNLQVLCFSREGKREIFQLKLIYESACCVTTQRNKERYYKHYTPKTGAEPARAKLISEYGWLNYCDAKTKCRWHDYDQKHAIYRDSMPSEQQPPKAADRLYQKIQRGDDPHLIARESSAENGEFHKKIVVLNLSS